MGFNSEIPKGVKVLLPERAAKKRYVEEKLLSVFFRWGFQEIITPTLEFYDVISRGTGQEFEDKTFKMVDRDTGRLLALRPDITPQVAKIAATLLKDQPKPLRLCYNSNVFRYVEPFAGRQREFYQAGVELIGLDSPEADTEMIAIAVESLKELGLEEFRIAVSQVEFLKGLLDELSLPEAGEARLLSAIGKKDTSGLEAELDALGISGARRRALVELPNIFGKEEVFKAAAALATNERSKRALENLTQIYGMLKAYGLERYVLIDLSEVRGFNYYTGAVFEGFIKEIGYEICGGGRYDTLIGRFGASTPSTGFAIDVERLISIMDKMGLLDIKQGADFLLIDFKEDKKQALELSRELRKRGYSVARDIIKRDLDGSLAYAARLGIARAIILGLPGASLNEAIIKDPLSGTEMRIPLQGLIEFIENNYGGLRSAEGMGGAARK